MIIHKQSKTIDEILASKLEVRFLPMVLICSDSSIGRIQDYGSYDEGSTPSRCTKYSPVAQLVEATDSKPVQ